MRGFNYKKAVQALNQLASLNGGTLNKMKALKLIWLSDRLHIRKYGRTITEDEYFALKNGSVPSATRDILESTDFSSDVALDYASGYILSTDRFNYKSVSAPNMKVFSKTDIEALNIIYNTYSDLDHFELSELSHIFPEWKRHESALQKRLSSRYPIEFDDFFISVDDGRKIFNEVDSTEVSKKIFEERNKLLAVLK